MFCNDRASFIDIFRGGVGVGEMQMYYSPCLTKHPSGSVNMPSVLVYFTFNDLGIKRSHYTFRPYPVDFFFTHLVSVSWLAFFCVSIWLMVLLLQILFI